MVEIELRDAFFRRLLTPLRARLVALERRSFLRLRSLAERREAARATRRGQSPTPDHLLTGERGEDLAFFHLRSLGYTLVARRWVSARVRGDLDLVAWDGDTLVVFEIKTRTARDLFPAAAEVDAAKQRQLRRLAAAYLAQLPARHRANVPVRFDILSVYIVADHPEFEHTPNAFPYRAVSRS
ncbi:MAG TPA: YraN family protein [Acidobacteriaceae bacterium]|jgi:putative endonuclease|nr:YraN family protein [Acidobacteriaceae bacterium]